ncbi:hypothetical protein M378DRAFT_164276, partial [Amanita muscaria Koide BX008]
MEVAIYSNPSPTNPMAPEASNFNSGDRHLLIATERMFDLLVIFLYVQANSVPVGNNWMN